MFLHSVELKNDWTAENAEMTVAKTLHVQTSTITAEGVFGRYGYDNKKGQGTTKRQRSDRYRSCNAYNITPNGLYKRGQVTQCFHKNSLTATASSTSSPIGASI